MRGMSQRITEAAEAIRARGPYGPRVGLVLGTGLGGLAAKVDAAVTIPNAEIPHFPASTSPSHAGRLVLGELEGVPVAALEGRVHSYEGYSLAEVTFPVRVLKELGVDTLVVTNAAGGLNPRFGLADVMLIEDHIDLLSDNPLRGVNDDSLGPRFPDMLEPYDRGLMTLAKDTALAEGIGLREGVFVAVAGPNLETRAEYRMLRGFGADAVGMSTVPEAIVAKHAGLRCLAFSVITDLCLPDALEPVDIDKILATAARGGDTLERLLTALLPKL